MTWSPLESPPAQKSPLDKLCDFLSFDPWQIPSSPHWSSVGFRVKKDDVWHKWFVYLQGDWPKMIKFDIAARIISQMILTKAPFTLCMFLSWPLSSAIHVNKYCKYWLLIHPILNFLHSSSPEYWLLFQELLPLLNYLQSTVGKPLFW